MQTMRSGVVFPVGLAVGREQGGRLIADLMFSPRRSSGSGKRDGKRMSLGAEVRERSEVSPPDDRTYFCPHSVILKMHKARPVAPARSISLWFML